MADNIFAPGGATTSSALPCVILIGAAVVGALTFHTLEEVAARKIAKDCHQQKQFNVGAQVFDCKARALRQGGAA